MDAGRFDAFSRALSDSVHNGSTRRGVARFIGGLTTGALLAPLLGLADADAKKRKKKKKKKKNPSQPSQCASGEIACQYLCCSATQECCSGPKTLSPLCYDPATESCCLDLGGQMGAACPPGTRCEFFDDPNDTIGATSFCCPFGTSTCGFGCCPEGTVCCPSEGDPGYVWMCCPNSSCDEVNTDCIFVGDSIVDPRGI
jgi:hypothetical protein